MYIRLFASNVPPCCNDSWSNTSPAGMALSDSTNNNWTPNWGPALRIEFYPAAGVAGRFEYYTGTAVVPMTGSMSATTVSWQAGNLGIKGVLEVHGIDRFTSVRRNNQTLGSADFQYNAATGVMTIPLSGATSVQIRR